MSSIEMTINFIVETIKDAAVKNKDLFLKNSEAKTYAEFKNDFVMESVKWLRPYFLKEDAEIIREIGNHPDDPIALMRIHKKISKLVKDDPTFAPHLENILDEIYENYKNESKSGKQNNIIVNQTINNSINIINNINLK